MAALFGHAAVRSDSLHATPLPRNLICPAPALRQYTRNPTQSPPLSCLSLTHTHTLTEYGVLFHSTVTVRIWMAVATVPCQQPTRRKAQLLPPTHSPTYAHRHRAGPQQHAPRCC